MKSPLAALALLSVFVLAACTAGPDPAGAGGATDEPSDPASESNALLDLECADLVEGADLASAFGVEVPARDPYVEGWGGFYSVTTVALELAGATRCSWGDGNGEEHHYLDLELLPHSGQAFLGFASELRLFQPLEIDFAQGGWSSCVPESSERGCRVDLLAGEVWVSAVAWGLEDPGSLLSLLDGVASVVSAVDAAPADPIAPVGDCESLLPTATVQAVASPEVQPWADRGAVTQPVIRQAAFERAGGVFCSWRNDFGAASAYTVEVAVLPGVADAFERHFAVDSPDTVTMDTIDGGYLGLYDSPFEDDRDAFASLLVDDAWVDVWVNDESSDDERDIALELATAVAL